MREELAKGVWDEACLREGAHPSLHNQNKKAGHIFLAHITRIYSDFQIVYSGMRFFRDIKMKIKHAVQSSYGLDTSQAPDIISRNASRVQALLTNMTFVYRVCLVASTFACPQLSTAVWILGTKLRWESTSSISTPHYSESYQYHVVPG